DIQINEFTPNLVVRHLTNNLGYDHVNLSSRKEYSQIKELLDKENKFVKTIAGIDEKYEVALFEYRSEESGLKITHRINRLSSYEDQDLLDWYISFKEIARICNWDEAVQLEVLRQIVDIHIQIMIGEKSSVREILHSLLKLKYNENTSHIYHNELHYIRQRNFVTTRAYIKQIEIITRKLATCLDWSEHATISKMQEIFFAGLDESTRIEITRYADRTYAKIIENLLNLEVVLISKFNREFDEMNTMANKPDTRHHLEREQQHRYNTRQVNKTLPSTRISRKYCSFHKTSTHNDSECRAINKGKGDKNGEKTFTIKENPITPKTIEVDIKIKGSDFKALIDTGSVDNYIPEHVAKEMKLIFKKKRNTKKIEIADGSLVDITHDTKLEFQLFNDDK
ncbi:hypothetical protein EQH57_0269, partial [Dictyocoela roeselum]